jgi:hypothetical protein
LLLDLVTETLFSGGKVGRLSLVVLPDTLCVEDGVGCLLLQMQLLVHNWEVLTRHRRHLGWSKRIRL